MPSGRLRGPGKSTSLPAAMLRSDASSRGTMASAGCSRELRAAVRKRVEVNTLHLGAGRRLEDREQRTEDGEQRVWVTYCINATSLPSVLSAIALRATVEGAAKEGASRLHRRAGKTVRSQSSVLQSWRIADAREESHE